jgi:hypothetical protein
VDGSVEAEHLTTFQNRMWFDDLLMTSLTPDMIAVMSKYLEAHDGDLVVMLFCFIKHFSGATKENNIDAYQQLTDFKIQLALYNNDIAAFTAALRIPTHQLANSNEQLTFQHILAVFRGLMDCLNEEFNSWVIQLSRDYRLGGACLQWTMLELLDELDTEYIRINALHSWYKVSSSSEIFALIAELSSLKKTFAKSQEQLRQVTSSMSGTQKTAVSPTTPPKAASSSMPSEPLKDGGKQTVTLNGVAWKWCQICFQGKSSWNRTHCTAQHIVGAGKGFVGKKQTPSTPIKKAAANLAVQNATEYAASDGVFSLRLKPRYLISVVSVPGFISLPHHSIFALRRKTVYCLAM